MSAPSFSQIKMLVKQVICGPSDASSINYWQGGPPLRQPMNTKRFRKLLVSNTSSQLDSLQLPEILLNDYLFLTQPGAYRWNISRTTNFSTELCGAAASG